MKTNSHAIMRLFLILAFTSEVFAQPRPMSTVQTITTALDHLTVLEYDEPVAQVAVGSPAFEVQRLDNKVFVKPLKAGSSTNLFVWTTSNHQFSYELSVGEVAKMDAKIHVSDSPTSPSPSGRDQANIPDPQKLQTVDLTKALTSRELVNSSMVKIRKGKIDVRFEEIFRDDHTLFIRYAIQNYSKQPYRLSKPTLYQLTIDRPAVNIASFSHMQVDDLKLGDGETGSQVALSPNTAQEAEVIPPGARIEGIIVVPKAGSLASPALLKLVCGDGAQATLVM